jgi:hypothetical protein
MHQNGYLNPTLDASSLCEQRPAISAVKEIANLARLLRRGLPRNTPLHVRQGLGQLETLVESHWSDLQEAVCGQPLPQRKRQCPECNHVFYLGRSNGVARQYCPGCVSWRHDHGLTTEVN